ncbi:hypothetical protein PanWU01x14_278460 [Parasponia andersonii]|uniref:Uncharacterized protein n=1 Tax=Parasponia andersonii TaxID=3476 RepID=A0A2P5B220_PARAD|nr:hypothetical protein PanWU01x14_278460 [Parasponia andersonii]
MAVIRSKFNISTTETSITEFNNKLAEKKNSLEESLSLFISESKSRFNKNEARFATIETHMNSMGAIIKSFEVQLGQLATTINSQQEGKFPSDAESNPKEYCNIIILKNGRKIDGEKQQEAIKPTPLSSHGEKHTIGVNNEEENAIRDV